ncbi:hypothetical protein [Leptospira bandrabouensis]|uniref:Uncharacterized protein n=1 Tax=Leptospira bandrabouensis TaxID=2484903 RepID=A0A6H3NS32_9LEPT|nr:hypothetical protein [Leptospira bandrabouensis]TGN07453.1 hypothetical protein EHR07_04845 [Leptospira bandrabouensis]TGN12802.1 hypothetical protein EHR08_15760 [Leptospira bandrabouensis]
MQPTLMTLEGNRSESDLILIPQTKEHKAEGVYLFGDNQTGKQFKVSLNGDSIKQLEYSPLYRQYLPSNNGYVEAKESFMDEDGVLWHSDKNGFLLGCSVCVSNQTLAGDEPEIFYHFNLDGSMAGYSLPDQSGRYVTLSGVDELGFFKGLKMPSFKAPKISMPKMSFPKISLPKFSMPKISIPKLPKISMPKLNTSGITKGISNVGKSISKVGSKIGQAVDTHFQKVGEAVSKAGEFASSIVSTGMNVVSNLMPGGQQQAMEEEDPYAQDPYAEDPYAGQTQEQPMDFTVPGYQDEQGYTASDGMYYLNDGTGFLNPQTNEWFNMDGTPYGSTNQSYEQIYTDSQYLYGENAELGFLPALAAALPMMSAAMPMMQNMMPAIQTAVQKPKKPDNSALLLATLNKLTAAKQNNQPVAVRKAPTPPPRIQPQVQSQNTNVISRSLPALPPPQPAKSDDNKNLIMFGGLGALALVGVLLLKKS